MDIEHRPVTALKGVGPRLAQKLERLGLNTVQDVLFHLPFRYQDRTRVTPLGSLRAGMEAVVVGRIDLSDVVFRGRRSLLCRISDGTGSLTLRFFHFSRSQQDNLERGRGLRCFGEARLGAGGLEMIHPEYELFDGAAPPPVETALTPVYPTTEGVHQLSLRKLTDRVLGDHLRGIRDWLPAELLAELGLPGLAEALRTVHRPPPDVALEQLAAGSHPAQQRLVFEELLAHHLSLKRLRERVARHAAPAFANTGRLADALRARLPFALTSAQERVLAEVVADLGRAHPMQRLVQGDVGSGKTIVAALAALYAVEAGWQVAVMAPTELLAEQHWRNFLAWLVPLELDVAWLSGKLGARARRTELERIGSGRAAVAVGTHALFQEQVEFARLGMVVVDEQHRFGVHQRLQLREKGSHDGRVPHQLIMTATPIPRTLAQAFYADLDVSVIDALPPGRKAVETVVVPDTRRAEVVARVAAACADGRQVYWVCPLIEESETLQLQTATDTEAALRAALPNLSIALVHGRMKPAEKEKAMAAFKDGGVQLLVATTVIEVGVDVPNASLMIIENAERLGLSQLHQLRGRVGRGSAQSSCVLMYHAPLSPAARERLSVIRAIHDGFEIARKDLEMRGPGEVLGTRQTGDQAFHIADLVRDQALLPRIDRAARLLAERHPDRIAPIIRRWLGVREDYGEV
ncbi:MAG TPA: ATP-dependent DNA helicase RecG [Acidiferrobacterales bacterium]